MPNRLNIDRNIKKEDYPMSETSDKSVVTPYILDELSHPLEK